MKKILTYMLAVLLIAAVFSGCAQKTGAPQMGSDDGSISVVTTIFPPYDFARTVSGGKADISMLIDPGAEVHTFDPTTEDIIKVQECDVFIYIGGENEAWVDTVLESMDTSGKQIVRLMDVVTPVEEEIVEGMQHAYEEGEEHAGQEHADEEHAHEEGEEHADEEHVNEEGEEHSHEGEFDEHIWTSPKNAIQMVNAIMDALSKADAANAEAYKQNAADYTVQISGVGESIQGIVNNAARKLIVVADRFPFRYLTDEFGLDYSAAFSGCSAESDVSVGTLTYLIDKVKAENIPYIYYIELSNKKVAEAVAEQTGAEMLLLHSCHNVTKDDFDAGVTYLSLMKQNADTLEKGLN